MNEKEARQHARDIETVEKAVSDAKRGKSDPPHQGNDMFRAILEQTIYPPTKQEKHDRDVYKAAYDEAKKKH